MADEYIKREDARRAIEHADPAFCYCLDAVLAADVVEVKHGRWIKLDAYKGVEQFKCSICRNECYVPTCMGEPMYAFCPNCGNPMDEEEEHNEA